MEATYSKNDKLKSRKMIDALFKEGQSVSVYPLRLVFSRIATINDEKLQVGVSVSKKYFKKAVDRNYYKRVLRETYRLNKAIVLSEIKNSHAIMILYQTKDRLEYAEINEKTILLFQKFVAKVENRST